MHTYGYAEHGAERDKVRADVSVGDRAVVCSPVLHDGVGVLKWASCLAVAAWRKPCAGPCGIGALHERIRHLVGQPYRPTLGYLEHGAKTLDEIQTDHGDGHFRAGDKVAGEAAAAEVVKARLAPYGSIGHFLYVLVGDLPPALHDGVAVFIGAFAAGVEAGRAGVEQVYDAAVVLGLALEVVAGDALRGLGRPVCAHVGEDLGAVGQQLHKEHAKAVEHVVFGRKDHRFLRAFKVEGGVEHGLGIVAVGPVIGPLPLTLEAGGNGVVTYHLLPEFLGEIGVSLYEILYDAVHFYGKFPLPALFLVGKPYAALLTQKLHGFRIVVTALLAVLERPRQSLFI